MEDAISPDAETLHQVLTSQFDKLHLPIEEMSGLVTDGAAVMTGKRNGLGARLKREHPNLLTVHCICPRLALACADATDELKPILNAHTWLTQLWKMFEYSSKKTSMFLKMQTNMRAVNLTTQPVRKKLAKRLKQACKTRWMSFDQAVKAAFDEIIAILHTLKKLEEKDAVASGLYKKMNTLLFSYQSGIFTSLFYLCCHL
ncbi:zinc finger MYM-type protein 1-like [Anneissia japonica]|uniref:zinc finger MYM-type protein 1-like n=1 Tax=Anneissia japonica TaxID=1529436 RepID=UPI001425B644|nr:zinc finger MYM-type protein 1-like [Anneissia japonica]